MLLPDSQPIRQLDSTATKWRANGDRLHRQAATLLDELVTSLLTQQLPSTHRRPWGLHVTEFAQRDFPVRNGDREWQIHTGDVIARGSANNAAHVGVCEMIALQARAAGLRAGTWRNQALHPSRYVVYAFIGE